MPIFNSTDNTGLSIQALLAAALKLLDAGDADKARAMLEPVLEDRAKGQSMEDSILMEANHALGLAFAMKGNHKAAKLWHARALEGQIRLAGPRDMRTACFKMHLALAHLRLGELKRAAEIMTEAETLASSPGNRNNPLAVDCAEGMAEILAKSGNFIRARAKAEKALSRRLTRQGPEHPKTVRLLWLLSGILMGQGDEEGASRLRLAALRALEKRKIRALERAVALLGGNRDATPKPVHPSKGRRPWRGSGPLTKSRPGPRRTTPYPMPPEKARVRPIADHAPMSMLAAAIREQEKRTRTSELMLRLERTEAGRGPDHPETFRCLVSLAKGLRTAGELKEAFSPLHRALESAIRTSGRGSAGEALAAAALGDLFEEGRDIRTAIFFHKLAVAAALSGTDARRELFLAGSPFEQDWDEAMGDRYRSLFEALLIETRTSEALTVLEAMKREELAETVGTMEPSRPEAPRSAAKGAVAPGNRPPASASSEADAWLAEALWAGTPDEAAYAVYAAAAGTLDVLGKAAARRSATLKRPLKAQRDRERTDEIAADQALAGAGRRLLEMLTRVQRHYWPTAALEKAAGRAVRPEMPSVPKLPAQEDTLAKTADETRETPLAGTADAGRAGGPGLHKGAGATRR
ncbi:MAG: tetratricopeptide repeat protein [Deltaproteobacteria bacterium]|jgi:tetratricopeptide (TPR) repeat protein|nr:tetratricopeptide repeat protein [Deltaproteobacteria bacterium]